MFEDFMNETYPNRKASAHATYSEKDMRKAYEAGCEDAESFNEIGSLVEVVNELKRN